MNPVRVNITVPSVGAYAVREIRAFALHVIDGPDTAGDYAGIPTLHASTPNSEGIPLHRGASIRFYGGIDRLFVRGNGIIGTLSILVFQVPDAVCGPVLPGIDESGPSTLPTHAIFTVSVGSVGTYYVPLDLSEPATRFTTAATGGALYDPETGRIYTTEVGGVYWYNANGTGRTLHSSPALPNGNNNTGRMVIVGRKLVVSVPTASGKAGGFFVIDADTSAVDVAVTFPGLHVGGDVTADENQILIVRENYGTADGNLNTETGKVLRYDWAGNYVNDAVVESDPETTQSRAYESLLVTPNYLYVNYYGYIYRYAPDVVNQVLDVNTGAVPSIANGASLATDPGRIAWLEYDPRDGGVYVAGENTGTGQGALQKMSADGIRIPSEEIYAYGTAPGAISSLSLARL